jgi:hypothetical protein
MSYTFGEFQAPEEWRLLIISRPFADAVKAGVGSIMCSYNQLNNSYGCQNSYTINHILKGELDFQGFGKLIESLIVVNN